MRTSFFFLLLALGGLFLISIGIGLTGCGSDVTQISAPVPTPTAPNQATFVGSAQCRSCHLEQYNTEDNHGHSHKLNKVVNGLPPQYPPFSRTGSTGSKIIPGNLQLPPGLSWSDLSYVVGGYGWKAYFVNKDGYYVMGTNGKRIGFALESQTFDNSTSVKTGDTSTPYTCGACHTTGWVADPNGNFAKPHHNNLPGLWGDFVEEGIKCEVCHGPGSRHIVTKSPLDIQIVRDKNATGTTPKACGDCHTSGGTKDTKVNNFYFVSGRAIDEIKLSPHVNLNCVDCHNPHKSTIYDQGGAEGFGFTSSAVTNGCLSCHGDKAGSGTQHSSAANCIDCHMPRITVEGTMHNKYQGDSSAHLFKINPNPVSKEDVSNPDCMLVGGGTTIRLVNGMTTGMNLDFTCYGCHSNPVDGIGGDKASPKTLQDLSAKALTIHPKSQ